MERQATLKENLEICFQIVAKFEMNYVNAIDITVKNFSIYSVFAVQPIKNFTFHNLLDLYGDIF